MVEEWETASVTCRDTHTGQSSATGGVYRGSTRPLPSRLSIHLIRPCPRVDMPALISIHPRHPNAGDCRRRPKRLKQSPVMTSPRVSDSLLPTLLLALYPWLVTVRATRADKNQRWPELSAAGTCGLDKFSAASGGYPGLMKVNETRPLQGSATGTAM